MPDFNIQTLLTEEQDIKKVITILQRGRLTPQPDVKSNLKQLDPKKHDVMSTAHRPNKIINVDPTSPDYGATRTTRIALDDYSGEGSEAKQVIVPVARIALAFQKLIVKRAVGITFGNPVKYKATPANDNEEQLYKAIMRVLKDNKEQPLNRKVARQVYGMTEVAERWYLTDGDVHTNYSETGSPFKIRCVVFSPEYGDTLYPYFDDNRDMVAFSRQFNKTDQDNVKHTYFETYTADAYYLWQTDGEGDKTDWKPVEGYPVANPLGKIPIIYGSQPEPEYADVETLIKRLEDLLSNFADTNDYHGSPKIKVKGHVNSFCQKGEAGAILELDPDADADYLEWNHAPESIKQEYQNLKELIHTLTQTPDISWDSVKGINVSGVALKLMFMDAVLKVKDKEEIWLDFLIRRVNLIKAMLGQIDIVTFSKAASKLFVDPEIIPYIILDEKERADIELALTGQKQLKSRKSAMRDLGMENVDEEEEAIKEEEEAAASFAQGDPTFA